MTKDSRAGRIAALLAELAELMANEESVSIPSPRPASDHLLLTVEEAAQRLHIGRTRMFALLKSGEIESVTIGRSRRIHPDAIKEYARQLWNEKDNEEI